MLFTSRGSSIWNYRAIARIIMLVYYFILIYYIIQSCYYRVIKLVKYYPTTKFTSLHTVKKRNMCTVRGYGLLSKSSQDILPHIAYISFWHIEIGINFYLSLYISTVILWFVGGATILSSTPMIALLPLK